MDPSDKALRVADLRVAVNTRPAPGWARQDAGPPAPCSGPARHVGPASGTETAQRRLAPAEPATGRSPPEAGHSRQQGIDACREGS